MLVVFGGLPGVGKTTIANKAAASLSAVYLRIDAIEQAIRSAKVLANDIGPAGYEVAYALAISNLRLGQSVVADCVNPLPITRKAWRKVASTARVPVLEVEIICSDKAEHRRRVETRMADIPGHKLPTWNEVLAHDYAPWTGSRLLVDTAETGASEAAARVVYDARALAY